MAEAVTDEVEAVPFTRALSTSSVSLRLTASPHRGSHGDAPLTMQNPLPNTTFGQGFV